MEGQGQQTITLRYIWDNLTVDNIIQDEPTQLPDSCSFAATALCIEYDLRVRYAMLESPVRLPDGPLLNYMDWEQRLREKYPNINRWKPMQLLEQSLFEDLFNVRRKERTCCEFSNGTPHRINQWTCLPLETCQNVNWMTDFMVNKRHPVLAAIQIRDDYPENAESPYFGLASPKVDAKSNKIKSHAVVLLGVCEVKEGNEFDIEPDTYYVYQSSHDTPKNESFFGCGMNILHPRVLLEAYYCISYPSNVFASPNDAKIIRIQDLAMKKNARKEKDAYLQLNPHLVDD